MITFLDTISIFLQCDFINDNEILFILSWKSNATSFILDVIGLILIMTFEIYLENLFSAIFIRNDK